MLIRALPAFGTKFTISLKPNEAAWETLRKPFLCPFPASIPLASRAQVRNQVRHYDHNRHTLTLNTDKVSSAADRALLDQCIRDRIASNRQWIDHHDEAPELRGKKAKKASGGRDKSRPYTGA